jgi:NADPH-dependent curcumin reductase CurA
MGILSREIRLARRPVGLPRESDFELAEMRVPELGEKEVLVRNIYMSVDPYMRGRMNDRPSYVPPFQIGEPLAGACVGQVVESRNPMFQGSNCISSSQGGREYFVSDGTDLVKIDPRLAPIQAYLGPLGMPGMTAYVGLLHVGQPKVGETILVSAASGAVGSIACQIAKIKGCRVIGSAGSKEKVEWLLSDAGIDGAFNYKEAEDLVAEVGKYCPKGVDVYFENVGGRHLEAALEGMNLYGRIVLCGMISLYNATEPEPGPRNLFYVTTKRLTIRGFIVSDHLEWRSQFLGEMHQWIGEGRIKWKETIVAGIENAPKAFLSLFKGENFGKMLVKIGPDPAF